MSSINNVVESVKRLHGDERAQASTYQSYTTWLLRKRAQELDARTVLKEESPCSK